MIELDLIQVNASSPYPVSFDTATHLYKFISDYGVSFSVAFEKNDLLDSGESYQFALTNYEGVKSPRDNKVRKTVLAIIIININNQTNFNVRLEVSPMKMGETPKLDAYHSSGD